MATYTVAQLKELTSVSSVAGWSDDKILLMQSTAESIIDSLDLDASITGYAQAVRVAVVSLFDWLADNPTSLRSRGSGKQSKSFIETLPGTVKLILDKYMEGSGGSFAPSKIQRSDIGLR